MLERRRTRSCFLWEAVVRRFFLSLDGACHLPANSPTAWSGFSVSSLQHQLSSSCTFTFPSSPASLPLSPSFPRLDRHQLILSRLFLPRVDSQVFQHPPTTTPTLTRSLLVSFTSPHHLTFSSAHTFNTDRRPSRLTQLVSDSYVSPLPATALAGEDFQSLRRFGARETGKGGELGE
jgi:hypothetical protein